MPGGNFLTDEQELQLAEMVGGAEGRERAERCQRADAYMHEALKNLVPESPALSAERERELLRKACEGPGDEFEAFRLARAAEAPVVLVGEPSREELTRTLWSEVYRLMGERKDPGDGRGVPIVVIQSRVHEHDLVPPFKPSLEGYELLQLPLDDEGSR